MTPQDDIARLREQLRAVSELLDQAEERLRTVTAATADADGPRVASDSAPTVAEASSGAWQAIIAPGVVATPRDPEGVGEGWWASLAGWFSEGSRALAAVGGTVLVLGLAFLYVLASQRGILGPTGRTVTGAVVSLGLVGLGVAVERRLRQTVGAVAAAGAGVAGLYLALVAATRLYGLIDQAPALALAGLVAATAVYLARAWRAQVLAAFALCGALCAPVLVGADISPSTIAFVMVVSAAVGWLWLAEGWRGVAFWGAILSAPYAILLIAGAAAADRDMPLAWNDFGQGVLGAALYWLLLVCIAVAHHRIRGDEGPPLAVTLQLAIAGAAYAVVGAEAAFHDRGAGWALLGVAVAYTALMAVPRLVRRPSFDLLTAFGLIAAAAVLLAMVDLLGGGGRATVLAAEGAGLALVAWRTDLHRVLGASAVYLVIAAGFCVVEAAPLEDLVDFPPERLMNAAGTGLDVGAAVAAIVAVLMLAGAATTFAVAADRIDWGNRAPAVGAAATLLYGVATAIVVGTLLVSFTPGGFQGAHAAVSIVWGLAALAILVAGLRRARTLLRAAGLGLLGLTLARLILFDLAQLSALSRALAFVVVGALFVAGSIAIQRVPPGPEPSDT